MAEVLIPQAVGFGGAGGAGGGGEAGLSADYEAALGKYTATGFSGDPTVYDPASAAWDDAAWESADWVTASKQLRRIVGAQNGEVYALVGATGANGANDQNRAGNLDAFAQNDDGFAETLLRASAFEGPQLRAVLELDVTGSHAYLHARDDYASLEIQMAAAQSASPLVIKDSDGNALYSHGADGWAQYLSFGVAGYSELTLKNDVGAAKVDIYADRTSANIAIDAASGQTGEALRVRGGNTVDVLMVTGDNRIGFFGEIPAAKPTGVAVDAAGIHAALVTLGLIAA